MANNPNRSPIGSLIGIVLGLAVLGLLHTKLFPPDEQEGSYAEYVAIVTHGYCLAPDRLRTALRKLIDIHAAPHKISVECAADAL